MLKPDLQNELQCMQDWLVTLNLNCPIWTSVSFVENFDAKVIEKSLSNDDFIPFEQYRNRFEELILSGFDWINLQALGIYQRGLIVSVEFPSRSIEATYPSINLSGPYYRVHNTDGWNLEKVYTITH